LRDAFSIPEYGKNEQKKLQYEVVGSVGIFLTLSETTIILGYTGT
jgi:hypothetical protein